jgi:hypothetical protein
MRTTIIIAALILCGFVFGRMKYGPYWDDVLTPAAKLRQPTAGSPGWGAFPAGSLTNAYHFDATSDECLEGALQLPHSMKVGTNLHTHTHWSPTNTNTGTVSWQLDYTMQEPGLPNPTNGAGGTFGAAATLYSVGCAGAGTAYGHQTCEWPEIVDATLDVSAVMVYRVCRDADATAGGGTDAYDADAVLLGIDAHIENDTPGSWTEWSK